MDNRYYRAMPQTGTRPAEGAFSIAGGWSWFTHVEILSRTEPPEIVHARDMPGDVLQAITTPPAPICGLQMTKPRIMGIVNVTPDSFSDGGDHLDPGIAAEKAAEMAAVGADILDIGGESTRPGADFVDSDAEIARTRPVIAELARLDVAPISIDTRKADVARAAAASGASLFNDVSALSFDPESLCAAAELGCPVCLMHASGDPKTMQSRLDYDSVLLDVYDYLKARRDAAIAAGVKPENIILDPGIGFGKSTSQNITLMRGLSLFHGLGCPVLLGASRKRFIGELTQTPDAKERIFGSIAVALEAVRQGAQIIRVHDVAQTRQALTMWSEMHH